MNHLDNIKDRIQNLSNFCMTKKAHFVVDGQYGSTGKGLAAAMLAEMFGQEVEYVTCNAGPNSGHTSYVNGKKLVLRQLPTFSSAVSVMGKNPQPFTYINSGAVVVPEILNAECQETGVRCYLSPWASVVNPKHVHDESAIAKYLGSTGKGTGAAIASKVMRDRDAVVAHNRDLFSDRVSVETVNLTGMMGIVEVSQGFSLGINSGFYPFCTSRECTVAQAASDAGLHPYDVGDSMMVIRTYPIRVGGNSGPCYPDQQEIDWSEIGVEPELTTVTQKQRRLFTFSRYQFMDALAANRPKIILLNFCNYMSKEKLSELITTILAAYEIVMDDSPVLLLGFGPRSEDVVPWQ